MQLLLFIELLIYKLVLNLETSDIFKCGPLSGDIFYDHLLWWIFHYTFLHSYTVNKRAVYVCQSPVSPVFHAEVTVTMKMKY